ncbi:MAG: hypothetical protein JW889_00115 [Verrucomicrobia bacterium]|nr:hypothetical protein [Verrucomicrobiota bacterium]
MEESKVKIVYVVSERSGKHYWNRIGIAFLNRDGSINVKLDAVPVKGEMCIRDYVPKDDSHGLAGNRDLEMNADRDNGTSSPFAGL